MIFFDLDGTLLDHDAAAYQGAAELYRRYAGELGTLEEFLPRWYQAADIFNQTFAGKKMSLWESRRSRIHEVFGHRFGDEEAEARFGVYLESYEKSWVLFPDAWPCLDSLKGQKIGLITNGDKDQQWAKLRQTGLDVIFSPVLISREVGLAKPDPAIFQEAARRAGVDVGKCTYIGDRLDVDALGSQRAGMKGVWLNRNKEQKTLPEGVRMIESLAGLEWS
jgi:putative hydrolase of the HAD superfamily